jgi:hypothetical protein
VTQLCVLAVLCSRHSGYWILFGFLVDVGVHLLAYRANQLKSFQFFLVVLFGDRATYTASLDHVPLLNTIEFNLSRRASHKSSCTYDFGLGCL